MNPEQAAQQATPEEIRANKHRCACPNCNSYAWLSLMGWRWCLRHWWFNDVMQGETWGHRWVSIKYTHLLLD